jgi:L-fuculose-phosphate aldolase
MFIGFSFFENVIFVTAYIFYLSQLYMTTPLNASLFLRFFLLHKLIYEKHPEINSLIMAHPHNVMAFALTNAEFDSRTIPESYIMLRNVPKVPFGSTFIDYEKLANTISMVSPVILIENDCVLVAGTSLINAFDRLEVTEYTAKSIINASHIGKIVKISEEQVAEIDEAFHLEK